MTTLKEFKKTVKKFGATFEKFDNSDYIEFIIDAPAGYIWNCNLLEYITTLHHKHFPPVSECYSDAINQMNHGISKQSN